MRIYEILKDLVDEKVLKIIELFAKNPNQNFYLKQIADKTNVSITSVFRIIKMLIAKGYITEKVYGPQKLYSLSNNKKGKALIDIFSTKINIIEVLKESLSKIFGVEKILLYGKQRDDAVNIIIIGSVDVTQIDEIIQDIKTTYHIDVKYITLSHSQFEQMTKIGMYSEERKQIYP